MTSKCGENKMWHTRRSRVCHWWPAEGSYHIREMTNILKILSNFDYQKSERILLNILRERWRHILTCIINNGNRNWVESDSVKSHTRGKNLLNFGNSLDFFFKTSGCCYGYCDQYYDWWIWLRESPVTSQYDVFEICFAWNSSDFINAL